MGIRSPDGADARAARGCCCREDRSRRRTYTIPTLIGSTQNSSITMTGESKIVSREPRVTCCAHTRNRNRNQLARVNERADGVRDDGRYQDLAAAQLLVDERQLLGSVLGEGLGVGEEERNLLDGVLDMVLLERASDLVQLYVQLGELGVQVVDRVLGELDRDLVGIARFVVQLLEYVQHALVVVCLLHRVDRVFLRRRAASESEACVAKAEPRGSRLRYAPWRTRRSS